MNDDNGAKRFLMLLLLITLLLGSFVLIFDSSYRIQDNLLSNLEYYPHIKIKTGDN